MRTSVLLAAGLLASLPALAQYPGDKPVTIIVPFTAGGPTDKVGRDLAEALRKPLGANKVAKAAPDGHTLLLHHIGIATAPSLYRTLPYQTLEDFEFLGMVNEVPMTLIGRPDLPASSYADLAKWLDANKGKINLANAGVGSASHLCGLMFQSAIKIDMTTVPYKGTAPAMNDILGGQVDIMCDQTTNTTSQIESGKVKAYAVMS
ncbi:MAG: tripartite tricarboxylate transporter substrate binding protein BugD, partial [Rubrivivax sp.]